MDKRLLFFEKDTIPKTKGKMWPLLKKLGELKNDNPALHGGKNASDYNRLTTSADEKILAFERSANGEKLVYIANMSDKPTEFTIDLEGEFKPYLGKQDFEVSAPIQNFKPWEYLILINK